MPPPWFAEFVAKFEAAVGHAFILHGNVADLVEGGAYLRSFLAQAFAARDIVVTYDIAHGLDFPLPSMKERFVEALDLNPKPAAAGPSNALQALMGANVQPQAAELPTTPGEVLPLLERLLANDYKRSPLFRSAVIIFNAEALAPTGSMAMLSPADRTNIIRLAGWGANPTISAAGNPVILVAANLGDLHDSIRAANSKWEAIAIPLPAIDERRTFVERWMQTNKINGMTEAEIARMTAGLGYVHVEDILLRAKAQGKLTPALIKDRKEDIIRAEYGEVLEFVEPAYGWEAIGGLDHVKSFFQRNVIDPIRQGNWRRVPMGVLMTGPAGTGKSAVAVAVAKESGINCVRLQVGGKIASKWQGEGERNLDKALQAIAGLAPTIVFIDEIDQVVSRGSGNNQQDSRIFQRLLEFMSDTTHRGKVVFLAATNRPDLMDAALRRPGRFDKKIPFLVPDEAERVAIFQVLGRKYGIEAKHIDPNTIARTAGWTGAEIEAAIIKAAELVEDDQLPAKQAIDEATKRLSPSTADIELMTMLAIAECNDSDLLPPAYRAKLANRPALEAEIAQAREQSRTARSL